MQEPGTGENLQPTDAAPRSLRRAAARAALASGAAETVGRVLTIVLSIATARALEPGEVGVLGLAVVVVGIISQIGACSETAGITTRGSGTDGQHAFVASMIRCGLTGLLVAAAFLGLSLITRLLTGAEGEAPQLALLTSVMLLAPLVELGGGYPRVVLQRRLDLSFLAGASLSQVAVHVGLSVILLWKGYGAMGVVLSSLISSGLGAVVVWFRMFRSHQSHGFSRSLPVGLWGQVFKGTVKVFAGGFAGYLNGRIDNLLVSGALGPTAMSYYSMAWNTSRVAPQILGQAFGFVLVPTLAQIQTDKARVDRALRASIRHSYLLLAPICAALFVSAPSLVELVLGEKWLPMVPALRLMSITALLSPVVIIANSFLVGTGRAHLTGIATSVQLAALACVIVPLSRAWGITGAAWGDLVAAALLAVSLLAVAPMVRGPMRAELAWCLTLPVSAAVLAGLTTWVISTRLLPDSWRAFQQIGILAVAYPVFLSILGGKTAISNLVNLIRGVGERITVNSGVSASR